MTIETNIPAHTIDDAGRKHVNFPRGARRVLTIPVEDEPGDPQDMTGWALAFRVRDGADAVVIEKATGGSGITVATGTATVAIERADTLPLQPGRYNYALWRTDGDNDDVLAFGTLEIVRVAAQ